MEFIVIWKRGFDKLCYGTGDCLEKAMERSIFSLLEYLQKTEQTLGSVKPQCEIQYIGG